MNAFKVKRKNPVSSLIASIPHGSSLLTPKMQQSKKPDIILPNNDWMLNELYNFLADLNFTTISANYSRYVIDLNRDLTYKDNGNEYDYTRSLVYHRSTFGKEIYVEPLSDKEILSRVNGIYLPYHESLSEELNSALEAHKKVFLFDLHSFYIQSDADVVLGTCNRRSCSSDFLEIVRESFEIEGFLVKVDENGLSGGYITKEYGTWDNVDAIQIELRYTAYIENRVFIEEEVTSKNDQLFNETQKRLSGVFEKISKILQDNNLTLN